MNGAHPRTYDQRSSTRDRCKGTDLDGAALGREAAETVVKCTCRFWAHYAGRSRRHDGERRGLAQALLCVGRAEGGHKPTVLQTLCRTCLLHDINPCDYVRDVLVRVQGQPNSDLDAPLPTTWAAGSGQEQLAA